MAAATFQTVYNGVPELGTLIMDPLGLSGLIALSRTSKTNHIRVQHYMRSKLAQIFAPFGMSRSDVMIHLRSTESFIIGSITLKVVMPSTWSISTDNIDIVVKSAELHLLEEWIKIKCGYKLKAANHTNVGYEAPFKFCYSYTRQIGQQKMDINLLVVDQVSKVYELIFHASNTTGMNMLNHQGVFSAYPGLLDRGHAVSNHVTNMVSMRTLYTTAERRQDRKDRMNDSKARSRGFTFVTSDPSPHPYGSCYGCPHVSACPITIRNMNDSMCAYMRLLGEERDWSDLSTQHNRRPGLIWRLADVEEGMQGFAYLLTYCRINSIP